VRAKKCRRARNPVLKPLLYDSSHNKNAGAFVHTQDNRLGAPAGVLAQGFATHIDTDEGFTTWGPANRTSRDQGFTTEDILWALGIWSVIICLSPVILFYMLMVA